MILLSKFPYGHSYWSYLDDLVSELVQAKCKGIQEKIADVDNYHKFMSAESELEIARVLSGKGKQVELLPDAYLTGPSPDLLVTDSIGQAYVEVTRFNEDEFVSISLSHTTHTELNLEPCKEGDLIICIVSEFSDTLATNHVDTGGAERPKKVPLKT